MPSPALNTAWTIPAIASSITHLTKTSRPIPAPGAHQVLIRMTAASLNFRDVLITSRSPHYPGAHKPDLVPGSDGAGIIHAAGAASTWRSKEGVKVVLHANDWLSGPVHNLSLDSVLGGTGVDGTVQEYLVVDDAWVIVAPEGLSAVECASLVTAGTTAWAALRGSLDMRLDGELGAWEGAWTGKRLLGRTVLTMGTGGVSCFAIQIAAALGATVIATSSSDRKLDFAKSLGATYVVNYAKQPEWDQEVLRLTGGKGVDHVIETGGAETLMRSINATRMGGLISVLGILTPNTPIDASFVPSVLFGAKIEVLKGCVAFSRDLVAELAQFVEANDIKPVIAQEFEFEKTREAFKALQRQNAVGKITIRISDE